ncbi:hypothetical protein N7499_005358 [Penicillium canescens]|uniref:Uncharacterized protein n=1 Tax=Penicillium canescens TaxID=5083 RepID=A0AAD6N3E4_PENCN|nr:uncharacterized protein N7446_004131 [Penicillium canescens]KAJ6009221.1 hypothetical protein N7522_004237 [Penicillium canescens]KAJ6027269.1 hypothetical protein N7460_012086 [Penicillium canescens]KAJ6040553.1 hypothetical protein N7444_009458 [Penicillium canescens]KAJ6067094.1 hypothetical protein N7446_004131 [Penicillium canescens]KAJ6085729.1 hypothetical protein N7499_005358 [Penicillium canescens]
MTLRLPVYSLAPLLPRRALFNYWVTQSHEEYVYSADGIRLGAIAITGSCAPIGIKSQYYDLARFGFGQNG